MGLTLVQTSPGAHPASYTMGTGAFLGVRRQGHGVDHPPPSSAEVKERVELYLYSTSGSSWPVRGWTLLFMGLNVGLSLHENNILEGFWEQSAGKERKEDEENYSTISEFMFFHLILLQY